MTAEKRKMTNSSEDQHQPVNEDQRLLTKKRASSNMDEPVASSSSPQPLSPKRARRNSPERDQKPVVVADTFETEASRQVKATGGLLPQPDVAEGEKVTLSHQVRHQVAIPPTYPYVSISAHKPLANPARTYPFTLDPFQRVSISSIERNESVLVSAHTSAGKTVVAEYAIAQCLANKQRVIYTSPIKVCAHHIQNHHHKFHQF